MKKKNAWLRHVLVLVIGGAASLSLVGCKETLQLKEQHRALQAEVEALSAEIADLENKLIDLRKVVPPASTPKAAAEAMTKSYERELETIEADRAKTADRIKAQQERIARIEKSVAEFQALSPTKKPAPES